MADPTLTSAVLRVLVGQALRRLALLNDNSVKQLRRAFERSIERWIEGLPPQLSDGLRSGAARPAPVAELIDKTLALYRIPALDDWEEAVLSLMVSGDPSISNEEARPFARTLAEELHAICLTNERMFRPEIVQRLEEIQLLMQALHLRIPSGAQSGPPAESGPRRPTWRRLPPLRLPVFKPSVIPAEVARDGLMQIMVAALDAVAGASDYYECTVCVGVARVNPDPDHLHGAHFVISADIPFIERWRRFASASIAVDRDADRREFQAHVASLDGWNLRIALDPGWPWLTPHSVELDRHARRISMAPLRPSDAPLPADPTSTQLLVRICNLARLASSQVVLEVDDALRDPRWAAIVADLSSGSSWFLDRFVVDGNDPEAWNYLAE